MALGIERDPEVKPFLEELTALCKKHRVIVQSGRDGSGFWLCPMMAFETDGRYDPIESPAEFGWARK